MNQLEPKLYTMVLIDNRTLGKFAVTINFKVNNNMKRFNIKTFLSFILMSTVLLSSCDGSMSRKLRGHDDDDKERAGNSEKGESDYEYSPEIQAEIDRIEANMTQPDSYWEKSDDWWVNDGGDGYKLTRVIQRVYHTDGTSDDKWIFSQTFSNTPCALMEGSGPWEVWYDEETGYFMYEGYFSGDIKIENLGMTKKDFGIFDTDMRLWYYGDAKNIQVVADESEEDEDTNTKTLMGIRIVDSTPDLLLLQDLETGKTYRYERNTGRGNVQSTPNSSLKMPPMQDLSLYEEEDAW